MPIQKGRDYTEKEAEKRRDEALKRALNTPPKPHQEKEPAKETGSSKKSKSKS